MQDPLELNMSKSGILSEPVLVGREEELEELQHCLDLAIQSKGRVVFVEGEAGAGKTRLVTEFLNGAKKQAVTVLTGWCLSNAAVPYFPFFEAFNEYFSSESAPKDIEVKSWLVGLPHEERYGRPPVVTPQVWKDQTFTAVANTLEAISAKQPVILFLDDLHWADSASLALVHYLAFSVNSEKVLILGTFRSEQLYADQEGRPHPLVETLRLMRRQDLVKEISVSSLDRTGVSKLANNMLGGSLDPKLASKIADESQGNPLFIVESLRMLNEHNELVYENNHWRLSSDSIGIPPKIKDIILQRLSFVPRNQKNILDIAAVIGEKFDPNLLAKVLGQDQLEVIKLLDDLGRDTSLVRCEGELYRFDHARTRDAIYDDISSALKRVYHGKVAQTLERKAEKGKLPLNDLTYQYAQAGNKHKALKYALAAGQDALAKWSNGEAIKHFSFVVQTIGDDSEYALQKMIATEGLGDAYFANDNFEQAANVFEQFADCQNGDNKLRALRKAAHSAFYYGDSPKQKMLTQKAEMVVTTDRLEVARFMYMKGGAAGAENDWVTAFKLDYEALSIFEEEYALSEAANILLWIGYGSAMLGKLEMGITAALRSIALYDDLGDVRSQMEAYAYAGGTFQACMFLNISNKMLARTEELNQQFKIADYVKLIPAYVWWSHGLIQEDSAGSISKALKALDYSEKTDARLYTGAIYGTLIIQHAFAGDMTRVDEYYEKLMSLPKFVLGNAPSQIYFAPVMTVYYAAKTDYEKANLYFNQAMTTAKLYFPNPFMEASARQLFAWVLGKQGKIEEAKAQLEEAQKVTENAQARFSHVNIQPSIMTLTRLCSNQTFPLRLDLVNVSTSQGSIVRVNNLLKDLEIVEISPNCIMHDGHIEFKDNVIGPFEVKTVKLTVKAPKGSIIVNPEVTYVNEAGETKTNNVRVVTITVQSAQPKSKVLNSSSREEFPQSPNTESDSEIDILKKFGITSTRKK
jgi:tetratricopeptide (TPR) repeat protein